MQLTRGGFSELVKMVLDGHGLAPSWLEIELTESALMADPKRTSQTIAELRELGVRVAIDDFGTGYSSLSYLRGLAIDTVKIDKSFIDGIEHNVDDEVLTSTIVLMAHSLGLSVVAEGVETEHQLTFLRGENCDEIQGYWLARPLDADACRSFVMGYQMPKGLVLPWRPLIDLVVPHAMELRIACVALSRMRVSLRTASSALSLATDRRLECKCADWVSWRLAQAGAERVYFAFQLHHAQLATHGDLVESAYHGVMGSQGSAVLESAR